MSEADKHLPGYRLDRHLRFARADVEAFLAATAPARLPASCPLS